MVVVMAPVRPGAAGRRRGVVMDLSLFGLQIASDEE